MLQYDLTDTSVFDQPSRASLPWEAEMFVVTVALLLVHEATYSDLERSVLTLSADNLHAVADCIEIRLPELVPDFERFGALRDRLSEFVGMCVTGAPLVAESPTPKPT